MSCVNKPFESLSKLMDHWMQGHIASLFSYIKDTTHMLRTLQQCRPFGDGVRLVTIDIIGLYTNMPHHDLLTALQFHLNSMPQTNIPLRERVVNITNHVLSNNVFSFENDYFQQIFGTAMGTPMAPSTSSWASMTSFSCGCGHPRICMCSCSSNTSTLFHLTIKFPITSSTDQLPFLDILISLKD